MSQDDNHTRSTRRRILAAMGSGTVVGLAGCSTGGDGTETDGDGGGGDDGTPTPTSEDIDPDNVETGEFVASAGANPGTFDPTVITDATSNSTIGAFSYDRLVAPLFDLSEFRGELATDWSVDGSTYTFQLREGVTFHTGKEMTAEDVAFSIERTRGTANGSDVAWIESTNVLGDYEIELQAPEPHAPYLTNLSAVPILPSDVDGVSTSPGEDDFTFTEESIGTGPFVLDEFSAEDRVVFTPYEDYWYDGDDYPSTAPWDQVTIRVITEQVTQEEAMASGELDMIDNAAPFELQQWEGQTGTVVADSAVGFDFLSYPVQVSPYSNNKFRRGLTKLIPRAEIIDAIFGGRATGLAGPISPGLGAYFDAEREQELIEEYVAENQEEAVSLIEEALDEEGIEPPFEMSLITNVNRTRERWMEVIQQSFDDTDVLSAELDVRSFDDLVPFLLDPEGAAQSSDVVGIGWTGGSDPNGHVEGLLASDNHVPDGFNWNLYESEEMDQLISEGQTTVGVEDRRPIYDDIQELVADDLPQANMWTAQKIDVVNADAVNDVTNWQPHPNSSNRYDTLYSPHLDQVTYPPQ
ncbi:ABC transporter substrate-binding protein [Halobaculum sp. MBLA0147]|uniref:ABC transporter substrate-binding protein n=1 Tax=Halobaculum sp. MBLA0147 TaxID=3079934 RepID=UPI0035237EF6